MPYEINVTLNGQHYFATAERSLPTKQKARTLFMHFEDVFPAHQGYVVTVVQWEEAGFAPAWTDYYICRECENIISKDPDDTHTDTCSLGNPEGLVDGKCVECGVNIAKGRWHTTSCSRFSR